MTPVQVMLSFGYTSFEPWGKLNPTAQRPPKAPNPIDQFTLMPQALFHGSVGVTQARKVEYLPKPKCSASYLFFVQTSSR